MGAKLRKLNFTIPDFLRTVWVSEAARDYWEPKIHRIANIWKYVERATLLQELRTGILQSISPEELPSAQEWALRNSIPMTILGMEGTNKSYGNASIPYDPGKPFTYRVYFGLEAGNFLTAWKNNDDTLIGYCLDFPECCVKFFKKYWKDEGWRDLTYHTYETQENLNLMYNNVLLRHIGIRGVFHLPCSVACRPSCELGEKILEVMDKSGHSKEVVWLRDLLSMPMRWTSLHGIAIVTTPILKTIYASDALPKKATLDLKSDFYIAHGARGTQFPYQNMRPIQVRKPYLNGFKTEEAMNGAHDFILGCLPRNLSGRVLDLGCGNGRLLQRIKEKYPDVLTYGVESNSNAIENRVGSMELAATDIHDFTWDLYYDLTLLANQRLFEVEPDRAIWLLEAIKKHSARLLIYSYSGWRGGFDHILERHFAVMGVESEGNFKSVLLERREVTDGKESSYAQ